MRNTLQGDEGDISATVMLIGKYCMTKHPYALKKYSKWKNVNWQDYRD